MDRFLSSLRFELCIILALSAAGVARADEALPSQDQALAGALENHPEIIAAKAKVAMANAELYGKRIEVSRQVLGLYATLKKLDAQVDASKAALNQSKLSAEKAAGMEQPIKDKLTLETQTVEAQLVQTIGQREQTERELRLLIGTASPADAQSGNKATVVARQIPQGPVVEQTKSALEKPIDLDFVDVPLNDIVASLTERTGVMFSVQKEALQVAGIGIDKPISLHTNQVPLHAALQAFQDAYPELQFTLRDYGVLVTTKDYSEEHGYAPVLEIGKQSATTFKSR